MINTVDKVITSRVFEITVGDGRSPKDLAEGAHFGWVGVSESYDFEQNTFPRSQDESGVVQLVLFQFDSGVTHTQVITTIHRTGYTLPKAEDSLRFAEKFPEEQTRKSIIFLTTNEVIQVPVLVHHVQLGRGFVKILPPYQQPWTWDERMDGPYCFAVRIPKLVS